MRRRDKSRLYDQWAVLNSQSFNQKKLLNSTNDSSIVALIQKTCIVVILNQLMNETEQVLKVVAKAKNTNYET